MLHTSYPGSDTPLARGHKTLYHFVPIPSGSKINSLSGHDTSQKGEKRGSPYKHLGVFAYNGIRAHYGMQCKKYFRMVQDMRYLEETAETGKNQGSLAWSKYRKMEGGRDKRDQAHVTLCLIHVLAWPFLLLCLICPPVSSSLETQL